MKNKIGWYRPGICGCVAVTTEEGKHVAFFGKNKTGCPEGLEFSPTFEWPAKPVRCKAGIITPISEIADLKQKAAVKNLFNLTDDDCIVGEKWYGGDRED